MATFIVACRLEHDSTFSSRWQTVVDAVKHEATYGLVWDEMTSLWIIHSSKSVHDLAISIASSSRFIVYRDRLLVIDIGQQQVATFGVIDDKSTLHALIPEQSIADVLAAFGR